MLKKYLRSNLFICLFLFSLTFILYLSNLRYIGTTDTLINETYSQNFAQTGKIYLEKPFEFNGSRKVEEINQVSPYTTEVNGRSYSKYPPATSLLASPFFKVAEVVGLNNLRYSGKLTAAFITAISIPIFYLLANRLTTRKKSLLITAAYGLGSSTFGISSQALWQTTMSQLISVFVLLLVIVSLEWINKDITSIRLFKKINLNVSKLLPLIFFAIGILLGLNIVVRTTAVFAAVFIGLLILSTKNWKYISLTIIGGLIPLIALMYYNHAIFGSILASGYGDETKYGWVTPFHVGFFGLLISPSNGILIFSPVFIYSVIGMFLVFKESLAKFKPTFSRTNLLLACSLVFIVNLLIYSKWWAWYGNSWVYRMIVDTLPYLALAMIPALESNLFKRNWNRAIFLVLLVFSIYIQIIGVFSFDYTWESQKLLSYKDNKIWFDVKNSHMAYLLTNQKYYVRNPYRTVYVLGDKFGNTIDFTGSKVNISGSQKIVHATFLNLGQNPVITNSNLVSRHYAEGVSFFISPEYQGCKLNIQVSFDMSNSDKNASFQIRELKNGAETNLTKFPVSDKVEFSLINKAEEIRVQNDDTDDTFAIKTISLACVNSSLPEK